MNKIALFLGLMMVSTVYCDIGSFLADFNYGSCLAFQDDPTDETTDCAISCTKTGDLIKAAFTFTATSSTPDASTFMNNLQPALIKLMG